MTPSSSICIPIGIMYNSGTVTFANGVKINGNDPSQTLTSSNGGTLTIVNSTSSTGSNFKGFLPPSKSPTSLTHTPPNRVPLGALRRFGTVQAKAY